ncbi:UDP-N-acetylmuramoyl-L-alanyl-D-glutamate--2,6-diaminopimelate ligase 1 [Candidatus Saccharibacteria bacterium]|nr:UDP-N-acetylmuramoyl-L-alanyl-D-glutamate--2,6-diaminopimelate ligase 1 [Candidatus Saccharibacteria bacterium]
MKKTLKKVVQPIVPKSLINFFHYTESIAAAQKYKKPSEQMIVIGIVGSKGKTTTANMLWSILSADGHKVGLIGTANIRYGNKEEMNPYHMTMPGAFVMQKILAKMASMKCKYVIMEVPSEGQTQYRHIGINFDVLVFTNVTKELMAAHDFSMETLHKHNKRVFKRLTHSRRKTIDLARTPKMIIANTDNKHAKDYLIFQADKKLTFGTKADADYKITDVQDTQNGISFDINGTSYKVKILGKINAINAAGAIATASALGANKKAITSGLSKLPTIPGRMEVIEGKQPFTVVVDYAHEQASMTALMNSAKDMKPKGAKVITLLGAEGGGRDSAKRPEMGEICAKGSDIIILSNVDPYEDDPMDIINDIKKGANKAGAKEGKSMFIVPDRREGIRKALQLAKKDDLVLITGKGAEQSIVIGGKSSPWDDRMAVKEELNAIYKK